MLTAVGRRRKVQGAEPASLAETGTDGLPLRMRSWRSPES